FLHYDRPAVANTLARHLDALRPDATTFIAGRGYLCRQRSDLPRSPYPDMVVAFGVDAASIGETNGYVISEAGKPPDFVLEIASAHTARRDYIAKRPIYAGLGVMEYWRYDHTGGRQYDAALAGDRLTTEGVYRPIELTTEADGVIWGYSEALSLSVCWVERELRFWDRLRRRYLPGPSEMADPLELDRERSARLAAETRADSEAARARQLEEELRRLRGE
ncbi:MAG: Uma2 family endonuclease, partial [Chloroflexi bacterium]|nr:Uma2 family endonuclease [Chloroflexota bacterium]